MEITRTTSIESGELESFLGVDPGALNSISDESEVAVSDLFPEDFVESSTEFDSVAELLDAVPSDASSFADVPSEELDAFVADHTDFPSWEVMVQAAGDSFLHRSTGY